MGCLMWLWVAFVLFVFGALVLAILPVFAVLFILAALPLILLIL